jgi:hypothetical protein
MTQQTYFTTQQAKQDEQYKGSFFKKDQELVPAYLDAVHQKTHSTLDDHLKSEALRIQDDLALAKTQREKHLDAKRVTAPYDFSVLEEGTMIVPVDAGDVSWIKKPICKEILGWAISGAILLGVAYLGLSTLKDYQSVQKQYTPPGVVVEPVQLPASKLFDMRGIDYTL